MPRVLFFDLETHLTGPGNQLPRPVSIAWCDGGKRHLELADQIPRVLGPALEQAAAGECVIAAFPSAFDLGVVAAHFEQLTQLVFAAYAADGVTCVRVREKLLDIAVDELKGRYDDRGRWIAHKYDLADVARRRLGVEMAKGEDTYRKRYAELEGVPVARWPKPAVSYAEGDLVGRELLFEQEQRALRIGYGLPTQFDDARMDFALRLTSAWGVMTDRARVERLYDATLDRMYELSEILTRWGLARRLGGEQLRMDGFGPREKPRVRKIQSSIHSLVEERYPGEVPRTKKSGAVQTGKDVLQACNHPALDALVEYNALQKQGSTYVLRLFEGVDFPIHSFFDSVGAATDRTSSSNPNLQNLPRLPGVRECFVTRRGRVFLMCDFDTQEMRTWAQSCIDIVGRSRLAQMYQKDPDFDPHTLFAAEAYLKKSYEEGLELKAKKDKELKDARQKAKAANFGFPGGLGWLKFMVYAKSYGLALSAEEAREAKENWKDTWPEQESYFGFVRAVIGSADYGRLVIPRSGFRREGVGHNDCANTPFQHLAAKASKNAHWQVVRRCYDPAFRGVSWLYGSRPLVFVHDESIVEVDETIAHEAAQEMEQVMQDAMQVWTPDVPARASATVSRYWSKDAERVEQRGRIVPWVPEAA